jgi:hypothetical protein
MDTRTKFLAIAVACSGAIAAVSGLLPIAGIVWGD